jgi:multicomponent K+:H+ antiporter subunit E
MTPLVWLGLFLLWLLLAGVSPGNLLLGAVLAAGGVRALSLLQPARRRLRRPGVALRLFVVVLADVVRSNLEVARVILAPRARDRRAGFVRIDLALRDPGGLAVLACILTATPGTAWVEYDARRGVLLLHVLDMRDEQQWVSVVKQRYERPLMEIFA